MKKIYLDYINFGEFDFKIRPTSNGKHFYMSLDTANPPWYFESAVIWYPNFIERWFGVTPESKLARYEKKLLKSLLCKMRGVDSSRVTRAINNFLSKYQ